MSRLKANSDFQRVRREGRSWSHPLIVLIAAANERSETRLGVTTAKTLGSAVARNRAKRRLREALKQAAAGLAPGWDIVLVARSGLLNAQWPAVREALTQLLKRANVLR